MEKKDTRTETKRWGDFAENLAFEYMLREGYLIMERNWRPKHSHLEIDLICRKGDVLVFVEVKARKGFDYDPADAVSDSKINKLVRGAEIFLSMQDRDYYYRFDIITVTGDYDNYEFDHIPDAFIPDVS